MNFYNMNKSLGLAQDIDIDKEAYYSTNIFILSDNSQILTQNFMLPNISRKLGSYIILDHNNEMYNLTQNVFSSYGYSIEKFDLETSYNSFSSIENENDIINFSNSILRNSAYLRKLLNTKYKGNNDFSKKIELILRLILIYMMDKAPYEKRNFNFLKKIVLKLHQNDLAYFKKIFSNISVSLETNTSIYFLDHLTEDYYNELISALAKLVSDYPESNASQNTALSKVEDFYNENKLAVLFIDTSDRLVENSMFCSKLEDYLKNANDFRTIPIFLTYVSLENVGYINNLSIIARYFRNPNILHIVNFNSVAKIINLYKKSLQDIFNDIPYGIIFSTANEKNIKYMPKMLMNPAISEMMNQILVNKKYCIVYRKKTKTTLEPIMSETEQITNQDTSPQNSSQSFSNTQLDSVGTEDELLTLLKHDIDSEKDSLKKKHFTELYNFFSRA